MWWINVKRVIRAGVISFWRNAIVSVSSIFVLTVTLFIIGSIVFGGVFLNATLSQLEDKVDINVYFRTDAPENSILALKSDLERLPEVKSVEYVSREQALIEFKERHKDDELIIQSLEELDENPLGAKFNIKAQETSQYEGIATFLDQESQQELSPGSESIIDSINYFQNKLTIERLTKIIDTSEKFGFVVSIILVVMAVLVTFNTIRLAIYNAREEISVMKLVGANPSFIRGPFVFEGALYGVIAALISQALFYPVSVWASRTTYNFFGGLNFFDYYLGNFFQILALLLASGIIIGMISSFWAVRRYLK